MKETEKLALVPQRLIDCLDTSKFIRAVKESTSSSKSQREAYEDLEEEFEEIFKFRKFSDFNSFRVSVTKRNKKRRNPNSNK